MKKREYHEKYDGFWVFYGSKFRSPSCWKCSQEFLKNLADPSSIRTRNCHQPHLHPHCRRWLSLDRRPRFPFSLSPSRGGCSALREFWIWASSDRRPTALHEATNSFSLVGRVKILCCQKELDTEEWINELKWFYSWISIGGRIWVKSRMGLLHKQITYSNGFWGRKFRFTCFKGRWNLIWKFLNGRYILPVGLRLFSVGRCVFFIRYGPLRRCWNGFRYVFQPMVHQRTSQSFIHGTSVVTCKSTLKFSGIK